MLLDYRVRNHIETAEYRRAMSRASALLRFLNLPSEKGTELLVKAGVEAVNCFIAQEGSRKYYQPKKATRRRLDLCEWLEYRVLDRFQACAMKEERANLSVARTLTHEDFVKRFTVEIVYSQFNARPMRLLGQIGRNLGYYRYEDLVDILRTFDHDTRQRVKPPRKIGEGEKIIATQMRGDNSEHFVPCLKERFAGRIKWTTLPGETGHQETRIVAHRASDDEITLVQRTFDHLSWSDESVVPAGLFQEGSLTLDGVDVVTALLRSEDRDKLFSIQGLPTLDETMMIPDFIGVGNGGGEIIRSISSFEEYDIESILDRVNDEIDLQTRRRRTPLLIRVDGISRVILEEATTVAELLLERMAERVDILRYTTEEESLLATFFLDDPEDESANEQHHILDVPCLSAGDHAVIDRFRLSYFYEDGCVRAMVNLESSETETSAYSDSTQIYGNQKESCTEEGRSQEVAASRTALQKQVFIIYAHAEDVSLWRSLRVQLLMELSTRLKIGLDNLINDIGHMVGYSDKDQPTQLIPAAVLIDSLFVRQQRVMHEFIKRASSSKLPIDDRVPYLYKRDEVARRVAIWIAVGTGVTAAVVALKSHYSMTDMALATMLTAVSGVCSLGARWFGWSRRLVEEYRHIQQKIDNLQERHVQRHQPHELRGNRGGDHYDGRRHCHYLSDWREVVPLARVLAMLTHIKISHANRGSGDQCIVDQASCDEIEDVLTDLGCQSNARKIARAIVGERPIKDAEHLGRVIEKWRSSNNPVEPSLTEVLLELTEGRRMDPD